MLKHPTLIALSFLIGTLISSPCIFAGNGGIRDNAEFFSDSAKKEAMLKISEIETQFKKELLVETFTAIPEELKKGVDLTDKPSSKKMYEQWAMRESKKQKVNGIYVLLSTEPSHLEIVVGNDTEKKAFTLKDRDSLASLMLRKLREKQNDEALLECVKYVSTTMASHAISNSRVNNVATPSPSSSAKAPETQQATPWGWIITAVLGIGIVWLLVGLLRSFLGGRGTASAPGMMPTPGGGGMFGSLLGGMFGAAAGMWLYDQFSGGQNNAWGGEQENRGLDSTGFSGQDTDYSATGGDFGNDDFRGSGGDDGGGGDGGGGDF